MLITIVSPEKELFNGEVHSIELPGQLGRFEVLENHAPLISTLAAGKIVCTGTTSLEIDIKGGFVEINKNKVAVCVEP